MGAPRIRDVAERAGVSTATVSRVLSGDVRVSEQLSARVLDAVGALGYRPNRVARRLRRPGHEMWALLVPDIENPFFTSVARGVEDVGNQHGVTVFVGNTDYDEQRLARYLDTAIAEQVAGIILAPSSPEDDLGVIFSTKTPIVLIDQSVLGTQTITVTTDHHTGGMLAASAFGRRGSTRIATIAGPAINATWNARLQGLEDGLSERGLSLIDMERSDNRIEGGRAAMAALLDRHDDIDGVFVTNNLMTVGALRELDARGIDLTNDIAVVGYDLNSALLTHSASIATVNQDPRRIGTLAAQRLAAHDPAVPSEREIVLLPPTLHMEAARS